ncbi:TetR/AcrR family transcriptional regulator [Breznakia pachnodae]|uniref:AcrR family transcriptional regulator n=1 Tax=Breznakia pachnodae TaxID=265178 RepID=A0ABU0E572_9FIRM|nr:TetR/AcrR family transcriptional regulator [Breznakia pachnodae]MDQ0362057.1 AcrR family transcriptional regulator [Breznakia pachnodae]
METKENKNNLASIATTNNLIKIARRHFSTYGFEKTSLEAIVKEVNMTRGALYHHFKNKKELFLAVLSQVQNEVGENVEKEAMTSEDVWEQLILGCIGFVEAATLESNKRILLIDSLNVVEWEDWRKMDNENSVTLLKEQLEVVKESGVLVDLDTTLIAHMISGALNDLSLHLAEIKMIRKKEMYEYINHLLKGLKVNENES